MHVTIVEPEPDGRSSMSPVASLRVPDFHQSFEVEAGSRLTPPQRMATAAERMTTINPTSLATPLRFELLEYRLNMLDAGLRKQASTMMMLGASSGLSGFVFAFVLGIIKGDPLQAIPLSRSYCTRYDGKILDPCYFPSTVSEMVHDRDEPTGTIFFFFEFIGAMLIFFSWYPMRLRCVYIGDDYSVPFFGLAWVRFRQYVPAPGMMMLSIITTVPFPQADVLDLFCVAFHLFGAALMFVGYFVSEAVTIGYGPIPAVARERQHFHGRHKLLRKICLHGILLNYIIFGALQVWLTVSVGEGMDEWATIANCTADWNIPCVRTCEGSSLPDCTNGKIVWYTAVAQLEKAANWPNKCLKMLSYGSEVVCGMFLIASHLVIWWYCEERHYDLPEEILHMGLAQQTLSDELADAMPSSFVQMNSEAAQ